MLKKKLLKNKKKITIFIKLFGGIGNQLFQFSLGKFLENNFNYNIFYENTYYRKEYKIPVIRIDKVFKIKLNFINSDQLKKLNILFRYPLTLKISQKFILDKLNKLNILIEKNCVYDERIKNIKNNQYLVGYWQSEKYFYNIRKYLIKKLKIKKKLNKNNIKILNRVKRTNSVAIHVRRNDYVNKPKVKKNHFVCDLNYYVKAIKYINTKVKNPYYFIFSDDPDWAKKNLLNKYKNADVINNNISVEKNIFDFDLMKNCKHFIISNSSFSWWACYLGYNKKSFVVSPKKWFRNKSQKRNPILSSWYKI